MDESVKKNNKTYIALALVAAVLIGVWLWSSPSEPNRTAPGVSHPDPKTQESTVPPNETPAAFEPEETQQVVAADLIAADYWAGSYEVKYTVDLEAPGVDGLPQKGSLALHQQVNIAAAPELGDGWYKGALSSPQLQATDNMREIYKLSADAPTAGLAGSFAFEVQAGKLVTRRYGSELGLLSRTLVAVITSGFQLSEAPQGEDQWTTSELGLTKEIEVSYRQERAAVSKEWRIEAKGASAGKPGGSLGRATLHVTNAQFARGEWQLDSKVDVGAEMAQMAGDTNSVAMLYVVNSALTLNRVAGMNPALKPLDMASLETTLQPRSAPQQTVKRVIPERSVANLLEVAGAADSRGDFQTRREAVRDLVRHAEANPQVVEDAYAMLLTDADPTVRRTLIETLGSVSTPRARVVLGELLHAQQANTDVKRGVARISSFVQEPGDELIAGMRSAAFDPSHEAHVDALWALAAQGNQLRESQPTVAQEIHDEIVNRADQELSQVVHLAQAPSLGGHQAQYVTWMSALGNLGGPSVWTSIEPWLGHPDPYVRTTAAETLRFIPTESATQAIQTAMRDESPMVLQMAVEISGFHAADVMSPYVVAVLEGTTAPAVKTAAAQRLAVWSDDAPELMAHIRAAAEREEDEDVRDMLLGYLPENDVISPEPAPASDQTSIGGAP